jgi:hypothetical protein
MNLAIFTSSPYGLIFFFTDPEHIPGPFVSGFHIFDGVKFFKRSDQGRIITRLYIEGDRFPAEPAPFIPSGLDKNMAQLRIFVKKMADVNHKTPPFVFVYRKEKKSPGSRPGEPDGGPTGVDVSSFVGAPYSLSSIKKGPGS